MSTYRFPLAVLLLSAAISVSLVHAALLGVAPGFPRVSFSNPSRLTYHRPTGLLSITARPTFLTFASGVAVFDGSAPPSLSIGVVLTTEGAVRSGITGNDVLLVGRVVDPGTGIPYAGTLLTGEVTGFGFQDGGVQGAAVFADQFDFRFTVTGGVMAALLAGQDIGVTIQSDSGNTFVDGPGEGFNVSFLGNAKGSVGPIAKPPTQCVATIGDHVWHDENRNGQQDANEHGINGVGVTLTPVDPAGLSRAAVTANGPTGQPGYYEFGGLCAGMFSVSVDTPSGGFRPAPVEVTAQDTDSNPSPSVLVLPTDESSDQTIDFGFVAPCTGAIGDLVWLDANNNGVQDAGEAGVDGVAVGLYDGGGALMGTTRTTTSPATGAPGHYAFDGLCAGEYQIKFLKPASMASFSVPHAGSDDSRDSDANPVTGLVVVRVGNSTNDMSVDAGLVPQPPCLGSIGDVVWNDVNGNGLQDQAETGINGVQVSLSDASGVLASTTTTSSGNRRGYYQFSGLSCANNYQVTVTRPDAYTQFSPLGAGPVTTDSNGVASQDRRFSIALVNLSEPSRITDLSIDFGFYACAGKIGNAVWRDVNGNGLQDQGEPGLPNVRLELLGADGGTLGVTATTGAGGGYQFTGLCPGAYQVVVRSGLPPDLEPTVPGAGSANADSNSSPATVVLKSPAASDNTIDFGFADAVGSLGDLVWNDLDADGLQDAGEPGIEDVPVVLRTCGGDLAASAATDAVGGYLFVGLAPGCYRVSFGTPAGFAPAPANQGAEAEDSDAVGGSTGDVLLVAGETRTVDAGFYQLAQLGDRVWHDLNANGLQDAGEGGLAGVAVTLLRCDGTTTGLTQATGAGGTYLFTDLVPGCYRVRFITPGGYNPSPADAGADSADSDSVGGTSGSYVLSSGERHVSADAGFAPVIVPCLPSTIGFAGSGATYGPPGNIRTFTGNGVSVRASAFSRERSTGMWTKAFLGAFPAGLGVTDAGEGDGSAGRHAADNVGGRDNYILLEFSQPVRLDRASLDSVRDDSDLTVWIGTKPSPFLNHLTLTDAVLASLVKETSDTTETAARWADLNAAGRTGNVVVIAPSDADATPEDSFVLARVDLDCVLLPPCVPTTFTMTGSSRLSGPAGNVRSFAVNGIGMKASAFSRVEGSGGAWSKAFVVASADGLGVTDGSEGDGSAGRHAVDNTGGRNNYLLLEFSQPVVLDQAWLAAIGADSDVTVWVGTKDNPYVNHLMLGDALLGTLARETDETTVVTTSRWADLNSAGRVGNVVVVAGWDADTTPEDAFVLRGLKVTCP